MLNFPAVWFAEFACDLINERDPDNSTYSIKGRVHGGSPIYDPTVLLIAPNNDDSPIYAQISIKQAVAWFLSGNVQRGDQLGCLLNDDARRRALEIQSMFRELIEMLQRALDREPDP